MIKKVLIANRGEIAVRVIRACQEMGIQTVAVYSTADSNSLHAKLADESVCIGEPMASKSYLSIPAIMSAVEITGADAIHPGYGFLSESSRFAKVCEDYGVVFIGPTSQNIETLGDKIRAREAAKRAGVPMLPGAEGAVQTVDEAREIAQKVGYPLIIKAAAGGGGRGMKIVESEEELDSKLAIAASEALAFFGNADVFIEKFLRTPRHIEIQLLCDQHGNRYHIGERDCTVQRRHQKLVEESPGPTMTPELRKKLGAVSVALANEVGYQSVGTVEFLADGDEFYFMEVNTRIQVEHPVTENVYGIDLIKEQIRVAAGEKILLPEILHPRGAAIECRINAEDPIRMAPWPGKITAYHAPGGPGIRIDSMIYAGYEVPKYYDSMIAKIIASGRNREEARQRMLRALSEMKIDGIKTNITLHTQILQHPDFISGNYSTRFMDGLMQELSSEAKRTEAKRKK